MTINDSTKSATIASRSVMCSIRRLFMLFKTSHKGSPTSVVRYIYRLTILVQLRALDLERHINAIIGVSPEIFDFFAFNFGSGISYGVITLSVLAPRYYLLRLWGRPFRLGNSTIMSTPFDSCFLVGIRLFCAHRQGRIRGFCSDPRWNCR